MLSNRIYFVLLMILAFSLSYCDSSSIVNEKLFAYVASLGKEGIQLTKINTFTLEKQHDIVFSDTGVPSELVADSKNKIIFIGTLRSRYPLLALDLQSSKVIYRLDMNWEGKPWDSPYEAFHPLVIGSNLFVQVGPSSEIVVINMETLKASRNAKIPLKDAWLKYSMISDDNKYAYMLSLSGSIYVIDLKSFDIIFSDTKTGPKYYFENEKYEEYKEKKKELEKKMGINLDSTEIEYNKEIYERRALYEKKRRNELNRELAKIGEGNILLAVNSYPYLGFYKKNTGRKYYIDFGVMLIKALDTSTGEPIDSISFPIEFTSKNSLKKLVEIDTFFEKFTDLADENNFIPPIGEYGEIAVSPGGKYIFWPIGTYKSWISYVIVIDTELKQVVKRIPVGNGYITNVVFGYE